MKHSLQLRLSQHLTLTPQLQQSIRLLQLSTLELNQELERFLQDNPLLERDEGPGDSLPIPPGQNGDASSERASESAANTADDGPPQGELDAFTGAQELSYGSGNREDGDDDDYPQVAADRPTLRHHLISQLSLTKLSERDRTLVTLLIESLDEDGYLPQDLAEIQTMLPEELGVDLD